MWYFYNLVDNVQSLLPNATDSANRLKNKPDTLQTDGQHLQSNVDLLKQQIRLCRDMVNR